MLRPRRAAITAGLAGLVLSLTACEDPTVAVDFDPKVGDRNRSVSQIETVVARSVAGVEAREESTSRLDATEEIISVTDDTIEAEVVVERDGDAPRTFEVRLDRSGRLSALDLVEGLPAATSGLDLATDLPAGLTSPPPGPFEPGARWTIDRTFTVPGRPEPVQVTGRGRVVSLGVDDGIDVAVIVVELVVPLSSVVDTVDGRVRSEGSQTVTARTSYDLDAGIARAETTTARGEIDVAVEPPQGIVAPPVDGTVSFVVRTETQRRPI